MRCIFKNIFVFDMSWKVLNGNSCPHVTAGSLDIILKWKIRYNKRLLFCRDIQEVWPIQIWPLILLLVVGVIVLAIFLACILHKHRHIRGMNINHSSMFLSLNRFLF